MLLPAFAYYRARDVRDAVAALAAGDATVLAGGQSLLNAMKLGPVAPRLLVDISAVDELRDIRRTPDGGLRIGAAVTYAELQDSPAVRDSHPVIAEVAAGTVDRQVRNRGTIGGNACFSDPTSNYPPLLVALDAVMHVAGPDGDRRVPADQFFLGPCRVALRPGELLRAVELSPPRPGTGVAYRTLQLARDSWALARAVARVRVHGGVIADVRLVLGCVASTPLRPHAAERALVGQSAVPGTVARAVALIHVPEPISDVHASGEYRLAMARVQAERALLDAIERS